MTYTPHNDHVVDSIRRIDGAIHLLTPILTDGAIYELVQRLAGCRPEDCGCLQAIENDSEREQHEREFAVALRRFLIEHSAFSTGNVCIGCHADRCRKVGAA
jgi:hypothetical protein